MMQKYRWTWQLDKLIHWRSVRTVWRELARTKQRQTGKIMHKWLPIGQCPWCPYRNETIVHLLQCQIRG